MGVGEAPSGFFPATEPGNALTHNQQTHCIISFPKVKGFFPEICESGDYSPQVAVYIMFSFPTHNNPLEKKEERGLHMNITIVCDVLGEENNGTTLAAMNLIRALRAKGHTVTILCPDAQKQGAPGYAVVPTRNLGIFNGYVKSNGVQLAKPDDAVIRQAIQGADIVHVMLPFVLGRRAAQLAKAQGIPVSAGFHAMAENFTSHIFMENCAPVNRLTYHVFSKTYKMVDAIHYPTQFLRDLYEKMYGPTNGYVISNGVNAVFRPQNVEKPAEYAGKFIIVATGRYSKEKNQAVLIRAVNRSKYRDRIQLVLAGSGPKEKALKKLSKSLPVPPRFGFFPHGDMVKLLNYADLYVHSAAMEAEGISCLEAISCGLVPIISDSPRCATQAYALTDRSKFRFDSPADLAVKIDWWLDNPEERAAWSRKYAENAAGQFDQEKCMDAMERMLLETAGKA